MQIELGPTVSYYSIHSVPGLDDRDMGTINGFEADIRSVLIDHKRSPLAVTSSVEPEFHSRDETSGNKVVNYGLETRLEADAELIKNRLYLGFNLLYEPETTRADLGMWEKESTFGVSSALAFQLIPKVTIGAELWYLSHFNGAVFNSFTGDAVYLGPDLLLARSENSHERSLGGADRRTRGRRQLRPRSGGFFPLALKIAAGVRVLNRRKYRAPRAPHSPGETGSKLSAFGTKPDMGRARRSLALPKPDLPPIDVSENKDLDD
jgi:hypothetical protein